MPLPLEIIEALSEADIHASEIGARVSVKRNDVEDVWLVMATLDNKTATRAVKLPSAVRGALVSALDEIS